MTNRSRVLHCGWAMSNGITVCGADAKLLKTVITGDALAINCKRCLNVLILECEKEIVIRRAALTTEVKQLDGWRARRKEI